MPLFVQHTNQTRNMKPKLYLTTLFLHFFLPYRLLGQSELVLELEYDVTDRVEYAVDDTSSPHYGLYEKILFMPVVVQEHHHERIYQNGTYRNTIDLTYPIGPVEDWQITPTRLVSTNDETRTYVDNYLYSTTPNDSNLITSPHGLIDNYMVAVPYSLPLPTDEVNTFINLGYRIIKNTRNELELWTDTSKDYFNANNRFEEHILYQNERAVYSESTSYTPNDFGLWYYDTRIIKSLEPRDSFTAERIWVRNYQNFERSESSDHTPAPLSSPVVSDANKKTWWIVESSSTHGLKVFVDQDTRTIDKFFITDMRGNVVMNDLSLISGLNTIPLPAIATGQYILINKNNGRNALRFIYTH